MSDGSKMPQGEYQPTYGSGLLLDGFDFDSDYGGGPESARSDPSLPVSGHGLSALPDGFLTGEREACGEDPLLDNLMEMGDEGGVGDLGDMVKTAAPMLTDLSWWEDAEQDPDRLPHNCVDTVIPELVEAWGVDRRTDGLSEVHHERPLPPPKSPHVSRLPGDQLRGLVASAMRRSAFGEPMAHILRDMGTVLGEDMRLLDTDPRLQKLAAAMKVVQAEHGVAGKVYLRDTAFPNLLSGRWNGVIHKHCASAPYWLTTKGSKLAQQDTYLGKKVVTEIPWADALTKFRPALELSGRKLGSGDPRTVLIAALTSEAPKKAPREAGVPVTALVDTVTMAEARTAFAAAPETVQQVLAPKDTSVDRAREQITRWASEGLLAREDAARILQSKLPAASMVKVGAARITASGRPVTYIGTGVGATVHVAANPHDQEWTERENTRLAALEVRRAWETVATYVKHGLLTAAEATRLKELNLAPKDTVRVAVARIRDMNRVVEIPKAESRRYGGATFVANARVEMPTHDAAWAATETENLRKAALLKAQSVVHGMVKAGTLTAEDAQKIIASDLNAKDMVVMAAARINDLNQHHKALPKVDVRAYADAQYTRNVVLSSPKASENPRVTDGILRWASHQMNTGTAGRELDELLKARFAKDNLAAAAEPLVQLRRKHEGLAGHLYVDASAYATPTGTAGCEKGGLEHRATQVQAVLKMDRCGSCVFNIQGQCQKYGKTLVAQAPHPDPERYQRETIRLANGNDSDRIGAMFFQGYDGAEFDLQDPLGGIELDDFADSETLGGILFDDFILPEM